jgi:hypothetical protein
MPDWPRAIDPGLLLRLLRRAHRPGLSRPGQAQRIVARHLGMTVRPVLAERLIPRGQGVGDAYVPIVHVRPPAAPAATEGAAAAPPAAPLVVLVTERVQVPVLQRTAMAAAPTSPPPPGQQERALVRAEAAGERATHTVNTEVSRQAADDAADRPPSRRQETPASVQAAPSVQTAPSLETAPVPDVLPLRSGEPRPSDGSPHPARHQVEAARVPGTLPDSGTAAVLPLVRGRPAAAGTAATDRPAGPRGSGGSEPPASATVPVVTSSRVPPDAAVALGLPDRVPPAALLGGPSLLPIVPEQSWPGALSPAAAKRRPPLPLAAGAAVPPAATAQPAGRTGAPPPASASPAGAARTPALPNGRPVPATTRAGGGLDHLDIDRLTDTVHARLLRRLAIERERRGGVR